MKEYTERRQLNNEGFSLIELLIAIVILSIIVVPLLHSFVTSARTNAKSRNTMHATAIAEDVMEQFEAHTLEEMADTYEAATPTGFTNSVQKDASLDVDGDGAAEDGIWQYTFRDEKTTSGIYDVVVTLDPNGYTALNEKDIVNIQNLAGNLNAVCGQVSDRGRMKVFTKNAIALSFTCVGCCCQLLDREGFRVVLMDINQHQLYFIVASGRVPIGRAYRMRLLHKH